MPTLKEHVSVLEIALKTRSEYCTHPFFVTQDQCKNSHYSTVKDDALYKSMTVVIYKSGVYIKITVLALPSSFALNYYYLMFFCSIDQWTQDRQTPGNQQTLADQ